MQSFKKNKRQKSQFKNIIATNHVSFVRNFICESLEVDYLDDVLISAEVHKVKPNLDFYEHIIYKYNIKPNELLFLDDNIENVDGANKLGINTIKVNKDTDLYKEINEWL